MKSLILKSLQLQENVEEIDLRTSTSTSDLSVIDTAAASEGTDVRTSTSKPIIDEVSSRRYPSWSHWAPTRLISTTMLDCSVQVMLKEGIRVMM